MAGQAKTADRAKSVNVALEAPCPECGKATRVVKRVKSREMGIAGGMYWSCTVCDFAAKK